MIAYETEQWHDLFVAMAGAAAALAGLLFVAVSINLTDILKSPLLPRRALEALLIMLGVVLVSIFVLVPGQSRQVLGLEVLLLGTVLCLVSLVPRLRSAREDTTHEVGDSSETASQIVVTRVVVPVVQLVLSFGPMVVAGVSLLVGSGGGLYWLIPSLLLSFMAAITTAWVLMVEILR